jgi:hypothetical protein
MNRLGSVSLLLHHRLWTFLLGCFFVLHAETSNATQDIPADDRQPQRWAVILVGLPGDAEHAVTFRKMADRIQKWLIESQRVPAERILRLPSAAENPDKSAAAPTAESIRTLLTDVNAKLQTEDALWVFTLGHGNYDGRQAWFHVAGKDPSGEDFGRWMADIRCREQVIWLTHASSGWFVKPLSRPGRIVIAATAADDESNETEFLRAFTTVAQWPVGRLDGDQDQAVSVAEFYLAVVKEVTRRFQYDNRLPTEHAQLDDNGDGVGTEDLELAKSEDRPAESAGVRSSGMDGDLARTTLIPYPDGQRVTDDKSLDE